MTVTVREARTTLGRREALIGVSCYAKRRQCSAKPSRMASDYVAFGSVFSSSHQTGSAARSPCPFQAGARCRRHAAAGRHRRHRRQTILARSSQRVQMLRL